MGKWLREKNEFTPKYKGWVSAVQAAKIRGCSLACIHQAIRSGTVIAEKVGLKWQLDPGSLARKKPHSMKKRERYARQIESAQRVLDRLKERGVV